MLLFSAFSQQTSVTSEVDQFNFLTLNVENIIPVKKILHTNYKLLIFLSLLSAGTLSEQLWIKI